MKTIQNKGRKELENFFNRVSRSYGMDKIDEDDFNYLHNRTKEMLITSRRWKKKMGGKLWIILVIPEFTLGNDAGKNTCTNT